MFSPPFLVWIWRRFGHYGRRAPVRASGGASLRRRLDCCYWARGRGALDRVPIGVCHPHHLLSWPGSDRDGVVEEFEQIEEGANGHLMLELEIALEPLVAEQLLLRLRAFGHHSRLDE